MSGLPTGMPRMFGSQSAISKAYVMAMTPSSEPIERSMLRDTMTRTMPVAMTATIEVWIERVTRAADSASCRR